MEPLRSRLPTGERQAETVQAVVRLAARRSPSDITTADIAAAMALTQGAVFRHFPTKEAIWLAVMDWVEDTLLPALRQAAHAAPERRAALQAVFLAHVDFVVAHPGVPRLIFHELQQAGDSPVKQRVRGILQAYRTLLVGLLQSAAVRGEVANDLDIAAAATLFIGSIQGLVMQSMLSGDTAAMAGEARRAFPIYLRGIGVEA
ncbi:MAG: TetR/AcrR family transcriptional regulator [Betaproteobacteria bacterium]|nr:TetR/AcrR family transcriptional regulator [Betaproteobacteria bacterium]